MHEPRSFIPVETSTPAPANDDACRSDVADGRAARRLATLEELTELGMDMARMVRGVTATAIAHNGSGCAPVVVDLGRVFKQLAQSVRRTVALEARLAEGPLLPHVRGAVAPLHLGARAPAPLSSPRPDFGPAALRRHELRAVLESAIEVDPPEREQLLDALDECLAVLGRRDDFLDRPFGELILQICRDLPLYPDWARWMNEDWVIDTAEAIMVEEPSEAAPEPSPPRPPAAVIPLGARTRGPP